MIIIIGQYTHAPASIQTLIYVYKSQSKQIQREPIIVRIW